MDTKKSVAIFLALILLVAGNFSCLAMAQSESKPEFERENREISDVVTTSCVLKITSDPSVLFIEGQTIERLLNSSGIAGKAARKVGLDALYSDGVIAISELSRTGDGLSCVFNLVVYDVESGEEFMAAVIENLKKALDTDYGQSIRQLRDRLDLAEDEAGLAEHELVSFQKNLRVLAGPRGSLSRQAIVEEIDKLRDRIQQAELDIEYSRASIGFSREKVRQVKTKLNAQLENDPVTSELEDIIQTRTKELEMMMGTFTGEDGPVELPPVLQLKEKLARAKIELAKHREELSKSAGADKVKQLIEEVDGYSRRIAEYEPYLQDHRKQLAYTQILLEEADEFEILSIKAERAKEHFKEAIKLRDELKRKIRMIQPSVVSVLGAE